MNGMADTGQPPPVPVHPALQALDLPVIVALAVAALIGIIWVCWKMQSRD